MSFVPNGPLIPGDANLSAMSVGIINANHKNIVNLADPVDFSDATTKEYVDTEINTVINSRGLPPGGTTAQVLAKASNINYDVEWVAQGGGGGVPAGPQGSVQYNSGGVFGGDSGLLYQGSGNIQITGEMSIPGSSFIENSKFIGDSDNSNFGSGVSLFEVNGIQTALIGAQGENAFFILTNSGAGWSQTAGPLTPNDGVSPAFGSSVSLFQINGVSTALIGGPFDNNQNGAAWIFQDSGAGWNQVGSKLLPNDEVGQAQFGISVSLFQINGVSTAVIGGYQDNNNSGASWIFQDSGSGWAQVGSKLLPNDNVGQAQFGISVSLFQINGVSTAVIGGYQDNGGIGAAWIFQDSGSGWAQVGSKLFPNDAVNLAQFGISVSLYQTNSVSTALIGGSGLDVNFNGVAWIFQDSGSGWAQVGSKLVPNDAVGDAGFGRSVSLYADFALIGGPFNVAVSSGNIGAAWIFKNTGTEWVQYGSRIMPIDYIEVPIFGAAVSLYGNSALIGGPNDNILLTGAAWIYDLTASTAIISSNNIILPQGEIVAGTFSDNAGTVIGQGIVVSQIFTDNITSFEITNGTFYNGNLNATQNSLSFFGVDLVNQQPTPTDLPSVIALLQAYGFCP